MHPRARCSKFSTLSVAIALTLASHTWRDMRTAPPHDVQDYSPKLHSASTANERTAWGFRRYSYSLVPSSQPYAREPLGYFASSHGFGDHEGLPIGSAKEFSRGRVVADRFRRGIKMQGVTR